MRELPGHVRLISVGLVPGIPARELKVGDRLMWNFASTTTIRQIADVSPNYLEVAEEDEKGRLWKRRMKKDRLVARITPKSNPSTLKQALEYRKMYKSDVKAGHADAALYWKGAAAAMFTANPGGKEPWQMTKEEFKASTIIGARSRPGKTEIYLTGKVGDFGATDRSRPVLADTWAMKSLSRQEATIKAQQLRNDYHARQVHEAFRVGKPVPDRVLADYPQGNPTVITDNDNRKWNVLGKHFWGEKHKKIDRAMVDSYLRDKQLDAMGRSRKLNLGNLIERTVRIWSAPLRKPTESDLKRRLTRPDPFIEVTDKDREDAWQKGLVI